MTTLNDLAVEIRALHAETEAAKENGVAKAREVGAKLIEAKKLVSPGKWLLWLENVGIHKRIAQTYMQLAQLDTENAQRVAHLSVREARRAIAKPRARPGRPEQAQPNKARAKRPHKNSNESKQQAAFLFLDQGLTRTTVCQQTGLTENQVQLAVEHERGRREAIVDVHIPVESLSMTGQQKVESVLRRYAAEQQRRMAEIEAEQRRWLAGHITKHKDMADMQKHFDEVVLPNYHKQEAQLRASLNAARKGPFTAVQYRELLACLHPDRVSDPALKAKYEKCFQQVNGLRLVLIGEGEAPLPKTAMPRNFTDMMAARAAVYAKRSEQAKRQRRGF